jgi:hypothetical protein
MKANSINTNLENYTARILALGLLAACLLLMLTGCQHKAVVQSAPDLAGTYALASVDGQPVPCVVTHENTTMTVQSGAFTITADGHCTSRMTVTVGSQKDMTIVREASCRQNGAELVMRWKGMGMTKGTVAANDFTMNNEGMVFVYRKQ